MTEKFSDEDLILFYYGERSKPGLREALAQSPKLAARLERLNADMSRLQPAPAEDPGPAYGEALWRRLQPQLHARPARSWKSLFSFGESPAFSTVLRFSLAGTTALLLVSLIAFRFGQLSSGTAGDDWQPLASSTAAGPAVTAALDSEHIDVLEAQLGQHLAATQHLLLASILDPGSAGEQRLQVTEQLLASNRVYRQSAQSLGAENVSRLLALLEPLLLELANNPEISASARQRMQAEVESTLLPRINAARDALQQGSLFM